MPGRLVSPMLVGRASELDALVRALDASGAGHPVHQLIAGEAGVGKSRLVRELVTSARARGVRVLAGGCADIGDGGVPYGPIVEAIRSLARDLDEQTLGSVLGDARGDLSRLVPSLGAEPEPLPAPSEFLQPRLLDAVLGLLQRLAARDPVLFVIEDVHWADPATRETIGFLARQLGMDRVLLVMTFRADELHRRHPVLPWLAELERSSRVERMDLERLGPAETRDLLAAILETTPDPELVEQVLQRSDGNPFFVEELARGGAGTAGRLPPTLRDVLVARIVALPERAQAVVRIAAVAGRRVDHDVLAAVAGMPEIELIDALRDAVASQVLVVEDAGDGTGYAFRHALLQEAAYDDLLPGERFRLHRAFGEVLAAKGAGSGAMAAGHWGELAYHWMAARDDRRAFEASVRAGEAATVAYAFVDARRHDERALELWPVIDDAESVAGIDRVTLLDRAARAAWLAGDSRRAVALRREAVIELAPAGDAIRLGTMLEQLGRALWYDGDSDAALDACQKAIAVMPEDPPTPELARVLAGFGQLLMLHDRFEESIALCERAVEIARVTGARQAEGHARNTLGACLASQGRSEGIAQLEAALEIARELAIPDDIGRAYVNLSETRRHLGDPRGALEEVQRGVIVAQEMGLARTYATFIRENGIAAAYELGEWELASDYAHETAMLPQTARMQLIYGLASWVPLLVATGDQQAASLLEQLRVLIDGSATEALFRTPFRIAVAEAALWRGDPAEAVAAILGGIAEAQPLAPHWYTIRLLRVGMRSVAEVAEVARARREQDGVDAAIAVGDALWADFQPVLSAAADRLGAGAADEIAAEVATAEAERLRLRRAPAATAWAAAASRWRARGNPYLLAQCRWREGESLLAEGDRTGAALALLDARDIATGLGARPLLEAVEGLAALGRIDVQGAAGDAAAAVVSTPDPFGLTPREREVLPLIVAGRTNRQIAEALFISENTAGVHVSNILGKLGASSRAEAAAIAVRLGIAGS